MSIARSAVLKDPADTSLTVSAVGFCPFGFDPHSGELSETRLPTATSLELGFRSQEDAAVLPRMGAALVRVD